MAADTGSSDEAISTINVTPFVDIILVVLIIFMVTTPIIMKPSINVNLPKAASGDKSQGTEFNVAINSNGDVFLNGKPTEDEALRVASQDMAKSKPLLQAIISADKDVRHGQVIRIIDIIKGAGIRKFAISIDKK